MVFMKSLRPSVASTYTGKKWYSQSMLYLNPPQLFLWWLGWSYALSLLPQTLGATLNNLSLNATPIDGFDAPPESAVCVNNTLHPNWGLSLDLFDSVLCQEAVKIVFEGVEANLYTTYDFYSRQVYPYGPGSTGNEVWPLAQGSGVGESQSCAPDKEQEKGADEKSFLTRPRRRLFSRDSDDARLRRRRPAPLKWAIRPHPSGQVNPNQQLAIRHALSQKGAIDLRAG